MWNCPKSSCHGAFPDAMNLLEPSHVQNSPFLRGTRGVVLLSSWVWKDVNGWALEIGISCTYSNTVVTGGQKHTHKYVSCAVDNHCFLQRRKSIRTKTFLDKVTALDITYTILVYENTTEVWEEDFQMKRSSTDDMQGVMQRIIKTQVS